jgi:hypothetical protein
VITGIFCAAEAVCLEKADTSAAFYVMGYKKRCIPENGSCEGWEIMIVKGIE